MLNDNGPLRSTRGSILTDVMSMLALLGNDVYVKR